MDKTYVYSGPLSAVSLPADTDHPEGRQLMLHPGGQVQLPADNTYVQALVARGHLKLVPTASSGSPQQAGASTAPASSNATPSTASAPAPTAHPAEIKTMQTGVAATATGA